MELLWILASFVLLILAYFGVFAPGISGPPLAWLALVFLGFLNKLEIPLWVMIISGILGFIGFILELFVPAYGTKLFKGSKYGIRGSYIGLLAGLLFPIPFGFVIGPFVGAYIGELFLDSRDHGRALHAAFGTFVGFLLGILINFAIVSLLFLCWAYYFYQFIVSE